MRKPKKGQSLAERLPELAAQWHPTKNGELTAFDVSLGSSKKAWWICNVAEDHVWESRFSDRLKQYLKSGLSCKACNGKIIVTSNCLATTHPVLASEWHPTKNASLSTSKVGAGTYKKAWWKCNKGEDHVWEARIKDRANKGAGCSVCAGKKVVKSNCLATINPEISKQWHPTLNLNLTPNKVSSGSNKKVWWKCDVAEDHEWQAAIHSRSGTGNRHDGCPMCAGKRLVLSNSLAVKMPKVSQEWHPTKNKKLTPKDVYYNSLKKAWWKCEKGEDHEWYSQIAVRSRGFGCPVCAGQKTVKSNCVATTNPKLVKEWHSSRNGKLSPLDFTAKSSKVKIWWNCEKDKSHEWLSTIKNRSNGSTCPYCDLTPQSKQELTITFELLTLFPDINPRGFKTRVEGKLWSIDIYIPLLHLGVEFDGSYWHKDKVALDKLKTKKLKSEGFNILRVREEPLKRISDSDIISKQPFNAKEITNNILTHIMNSFELEDVLVKKIKAYIFKKKLQNEKGLDEYIEMILTEKADKD